MLVFTNNQGVMKYYYSVLLFVGFALGNQKHRFYHLARRYRIKSLQEPS